MKLTRLGGECPWCVSSQSPPIGNMISPTHLRDPPCSCLGRIGGMVAAVEGGDRGNVFLNPSYSKNPGACS